MLTEYLKSKPSRAEVAKVAKKVEGENMCWNSNSGVALPLSASVSLHPHTHTHADGIKAMGEQVVITTDRKFIFANGKQLTDEDCKKLGGMDNMIVSSFITFL